MLIWQGDTIISAGNAGTAVYVWNSTDYQLQHHHNVWPYCIKSLDTTPDSDLLLMVLKKPLISIMNKLGLTEVVNVCKFNLATGQVEQELSENQELLGGNFQNPTGITLFGNAKDAQGEWWLTATLLHHDHRQSAKIAPNPAHEVLWAYNRQTQQQGLIAVWGDRRTTLICDQQLQTQKLECGGDAYGITAFKDSFALLTQQGTDAYFLELPGHPEAGMLLPGEATNTITATGDRIAIGVDNTILIIG